MKELKVGERVTITLEVVERKGGCKGCFFSSGLYYQPASNHSNLSKNGKVYMTNNSPLMLNNSYDYIAISVRKGTKIHDILEKEMPLKGVEVFYGTAVYYRVPKSEFEKEEL